MSLGSILTTVVGAALGLFGSKQSSPDYSSLFAAREAAPEPPKAPEAPDAGKTEAMKAAEEAEKKRRLLDKEQNRTNFTGGLGLANSASVERKTLLG